MSTDLTNSVWAQAERNNRAVRRARRWGALRRITGDLLIIAVAWTTAAAAMLWLIA